ncbi:conserved membrane protein of unknown function [Rhodovastum atsumiense]|uniref:Uncharacterized protein n=1 Tax=Rhodovastum atsumiense TaxID=504468 RepID=A0A5M6ITP9_9PROT|nr:hypothetical protein [Rhodovastum atsumiense]KAA5611684.1 hypothetical protein F1189_12860 [Rhodovastum atsumiense]CAH2604256.1 conserved membrane protein of unknown function [Rhodovastum atsumiense]
MIWLNGIGLAVAATLLCALPAVPFAVLIARLPVPVGAALLALALLPPLLPLPGFPGQAAGLLPFVVIPLAWSARRVTPAMSRMATISGATIVSRVRRIWLPLVGPGLALGLLLGFARALGGSDDLRLQGLGAVLFAASAYPLLGALLHRSD